MTQDDPTTKMMALYMPPEVWPSIKQSIENVYPALMVVHYPPEAQDEDTDAYFIAPRQVAP